LTATQKQGQQSTVAGGGAGGKGSGWQEGCSINQARHRQSIKPETTDALKHQIFVGLGQS